MLYTTAAFTETIVEGELQRFFGRRRMEKRIEALHDHYLVCGYGRIGEVVCRELATKPTPFVVIEQQEERARKADEQQYLVLHDDATDEQALMNAGVMRAQRTLCHPVIRCQQCLCDPHCQTTQSQPYHCRPC